MTDLVQRFTELDERNLQLDIFRENGQVLIQVFKYSDVKKWDIRPDFGSHDNGYVIEVRFANGKTNNKAHLKNFENSEIRSRYQDFQELEKGSYFSFIPTTSTALELQAFILKTIEQVYGREVGTLDVQLNAY